jgi:Protein of unknown function (DUF1569)
MMMNRRGLLIAAPWSLTACSSAPLQGPFASVAEAAKAVEALAGANPPWRSTGAFTLPQMLHHAAQSIEFSRQGFPEMKSGAFRATVGAAAFAVFDARGAMRHGLDEPIPGAPPLPADAALDTAITRLVTAFADFERHTGALMPHFAYGALDKPSYTRAHLMHLANHWTELVRA